MNNLTTGQLAKQVGVNVETIRFYERKRLLRKPSRTKSGYRQYTANAVSRVRFIIRAKALGFSLKEIGELLSLRITRGCSCEDIRGRAEAKLHDIEDKIETLRALRNALAKLIAECRGSAPASECPILGALDSEEGQ